MVSIEEAIKAVVNESKRLSREGSLSIENSGNAILSRDIFAPINMPPFRQSAMDGYALNLHPGKTYSLIGEVKAGDNNRPELRAGEAIRIFTGAPVPVSANAVIMQEKVSVKDDKIVVEANPEKEHNIRQMGEQVKHGDLALEKGTKLTPAAIGYLSSLGLTEVPVYEKASIAILTTGNELIEAGQPLIPGKIYESNSLMLKSALLQLGLNDVSIQKVGDHYLDTYYQIKALIDENDMVLITGGISVGDYDFVGKALKELAVEQIFYKVNQKPGKPLFFGKSEGALLFALPGNPAAALSCFYLYVYPAVQKMSGLDSELKRLNAVSTSEFLKRGNRPQFLKAIYNNGKVAVLEGQSSAMLQTFAVANALVKMPGELEQIKVHDRVEVILLPI